MNSVVKSFKSKRDLFQLLIVEATMEVFLQVVRLSELTDKEQQ